jgi:hypothetical protein
MLTPWLIQVLFWIGVIVCMFHGGNLIRQALAADEVDLTEVLRGAAWFLFGPIAVRLICEAVILFFRINETLTEIKNRMK